MKFEMQTKIEALDRKKQDRIAERIYAIPNHLWIRNQTVYEDILKTIEMDQSFQDAQDAADKKFLEYEGGIDDF
ncbi:MAG: hypothetical protein WC902_10465 [Bacteroidales bacterium]|jgi:hypothetical protein